MKTTLNILLFLALAWNTANAQVGIGTTTPDPSSILDVTATDKGFLPPRLTTAQRNAINGGNPAEGLVIYNSDINCLQWWDGSVWYNACDGTSTGIIPGNATSVTATISVTPCSAVPGATLNNDNTTPDGIEYDWTGATGFVDGGTTQALVEIGGQCWYRRNAVNIPSNFNPVPNFVNFTDVGWSGFYTGGPFPNEGRLYQWSAAMNGSTSERAQGVCPMGWHVPSDSEWMYLENTLGMTVAEQQTVGVRGTEGQDLSSLVTGGTNSSGFAALLAGYRNTGGTSFENRGTYGFWWSSSAGSSNSSPAQYRGLFSSQSGVYRAFNNTAFSFSVRCLKD